MTHKNLIFILTLVLLFSGISLATYSQDEIDVPGEGGEWNVAVPPNHDLDLLFQCESTDYSYQLVITRVDGDDRGPTVRVSGEELMPGQSVSLHRSVVCLFIPLIPAAVLMLS